MQTNSLTSAKMRRAAIHFVALVLVPFLFFGTFATAAEPGWTAIFNGRDLAGWQIIGEPKSGWAVSDGVLHPSGPGGWLSTDKQYSDFELRLEFNVPPGGNSGVFLRAPREGRVSRTGMEIQLIDDFTDDYGKLEAWQKSGSLYHVEPAKSGAAKKAGQWQTIDIRLAGRELRVTLNGKTVIDTNLDDYPDKEEEHPGLKRRRGFIGLQNYSGGQKVLFRNVRLREL